MNLNLWKIERSPIAYEESVGIKDTYSIGSRGGRRTTRE